MDIKLDNILVTDIITRTDNDVCPGMKDFPVVKIADFGLAGRFSEGGFMSPKLATDKLCISEAILMTLMARNDAPPSQAVTDLRNSLRPGVLAPEKVDLSSLYSRSWLRSFKAAEVALARYKQVYSKSR